MNLNTDENFKQLLTSILYDANLLGVGETPTLIPYHFITVGGKRSSHYKIICGNKKFFLKTVKDNDNTVFCLPYLQGLNRKYGTKKFPESLTQVFTYNDRKFYILEYMEGETLEELDKCLTAEERQIVVKELKNRLNELHTCTANKYSDKSEFYSECFGKRLSDKLKERLKNHVFAQFPADKLDTALSVCKQILSKVKFPEAHLIHMDVKPANIIFNRKNKKLYLIDFENARFCDENYGKVQVFLTAYKDYPETYKKYILPEIVDGFTEVSIVKDEKCLCYLFYQTACNLIYFDSRNLPCTEAMSELFFKLLNIISNR